MLTSASGSPGFTPGGRACTARNPRSTPAWRGALPDDLGPRVRARLPRRQGLDEADLGPIARGQLAEEQRGARRAERARRCALTLLCDLDVPHVPDRWRDFGARRAELHARLLAALAGRPGRVVRLSGAWDARLAAACAAVDDLLVDTPRKAG